jgi:hypothetical protein
MQVDPQMLGRLLLAVRSLQADHSAMRLVVRAMARTHPNREALVADLRAQARLQGETDLGQPLDDEAIAERRETLERWARLIESA